MLSSPASVAAPPAVHGHKYRHLYPPISFFHLAEDPAQLAAGHDSAYAMVWAMLHGTQPPLHLFAASAYATQIEAAERAAAAQQQQQQPQQQCAPADSKPESVMRATSATVQPQQPAAAPTPAAVAPAQKQPATQNPHAPLSSSGANVAAAASSTTASPAPAVAAASSATIGTAAAAAASADDEPVSSEPGVFTRAQLLSLFRPSSLLPLSLQSTLDAASSGGGDPWLSSCVSRACLDPLAMSLRPHPAEAALRAELERDAEVTGVAEYANEWWLPNYSDMAAMGLASGGRHSGRGRGGGGHGGKRGRGGAANRGGRGGYKNNNSNNNNNNHHGHANQQSHSHKKKSQQSHADSQLQPMDVSDAAAPAAAAGAAGSTAASPALPATNTLGAGRKGKGQKRGHAATDPSAEPALLSKKLYAQTNISRMFIGPAGPPSLPAAASVAPPAMQFVLPSGDKHAAAAAAPSAPVASAAPPAAVAPAAATPVAAAAAAPAATPAAPSSTPAPASTAAAALPSKESVFQRSPNGDTRSRDREIQDMRGWAEEH